jgi:hypothetical protein
VRVSLRYRRRLGSLLLFSAISVGGSLLTRGYAQETEKTESPVSAFGSSMPGCTAKVLGILKSSERPTNDDLNNSAHICYTLLYREKQLNEFSIRSQAYEQQYSSNYVLLWMVVIITVSGVILAGLQLLASYRLSIASGNSLAESNELSLARNQIVLKSSVTGLFVLLLSFAFFLVFVKYVYKIEDPGPHANLPPGTIDAPLTPKNQQH